MGHWQPTRCHSRTCGLIMSDAEKARFWGKVNKDGPVLFESLGRCWVWTGSLAGKGYGSFSWSGPGHRAHRISYIWAFGEIPANMQVDHACHNRKCVRPSHLRLATNKENQENLLGARADSSTGVRGVYYCSRNRWRAKVQHNGIAYQDYFEDFDEAAAWAVAKRLELFTHNIADRQVSA